MAILDGAKYFDLRSVLKIQNLKIQTSEKDVTGEKKVYFK